MGLEVTINCDRIGCRYSDMPFGCDIDQWYANARHDGWTITGNDDAEASMLCLDCTAAGHTIKDRHVGPGAR